MFDIPLDEIPEREVLPTKTVYTFGIRETPVVQLSKAGNPMIAVELVPEGRPDDAFTHWFTLTRGALAFPSRTSSLKKFLEVFGYTGVRLQGDVGQPLRVIGSDSSEILLKYLRFRGTVSHEKQDGRDLPNVRLNSVEGIA